MEVWTPYQSEHDLEDEENSYKPVEHQHVDTSSANHHGLFMEDELLLKRYNEKNNEVVVPIKKSKKRKEKEATHERGKIECFVRK